MICENGLREASPTVTSAFSALLTRGRMRPLKNGALVATKYRTIKRSRSPALIRVSLRFQGRRFTGCEDCVVVFAIYSSDPSCIHSVQTGRVERRARSERQ